MKKIVLTRGLDPCAKIFGKFNIGIDSDLDSTPLARGQDRGERLEEALGVFAADRFLEVQRSPLQFLALRREVTDRGRAQEPQQ